MPRLKRSRDEAELDIQLEPAVPPEHEATLTTLRNMWEFASFMQYIFLFGQAVKIDDDFDIEDLEAECLRPTPSDKLADIGLQLLKYVSSHRGLTHEIFDEYTRRQYMAKAPHRNPFGEDEEPKKFNDFDVSERIKILHQLSVWTLGNADRMRGLMPEDEDHLNWRIEPLGWDKDDRSYYVLDDNRLYRRTDELPPPPLPKPKAKAKAKGKKASKKSRPTPTRTSKRRKVVESEDDAEDETEVAEDTVMEDGDDKQPIEEEPGFGFTSKTWECIAITLEEYQEFLSSIFRSRDANEKQLRKRIEDEVMPIIEKRAEAVRQKQLRKIRELENLQKMATAKRSSRLAGKAEREKQERDEREAEERRQRDLQMALEEQERQRKIEEGHESRRMTREQRLREREAKRILHKEELARIEEQANRATSQDPSIGADADASKRMSERQLKTQREQHQKELERLAEEEDTWIFDCAVCGVHGENLDDGTHSVACEKCNVWQHSKCHGFSPKQAESDGFHFICGTCKRKQAEANKPKIAPLKLKNQSTPTPEKLTSGSPAAGDHARSSGLPDHIQRQLDRVQIPRPSQQNVMSFAPDVNGSQQSPQLQAFAPQAAGGHQYPPVANFAPRPSHSPQQTWHVGTAPHPAGQASMLGSPSAPPPFALANGYGSPTQHRQQHERAHQQALAASGVHPSYSAPQYTQERSVNGASSPHGSQSSGHHAQSQFRHYQPPSVNRPPPFQPQPPSRSQGQAISGPRSPSKQSASPQLSRPPMNGISQSPVPPPHLLQSPPVNSAGVHRPLGQSPVKRSSPPQMTTDQRFQGTLPPPNILQTPQQMRPSSSNGHHASQQTPQIHPSPPGANANGVAAGGMSGPWPQSSQAIPQKYDQSPAPPPLTGSIGDARVLPPIASLVPSPQQHHQHPATGPQSVPVKKLVETNSSPLPAYAAIVPGTGLQMQPSPIAPYRSMAVNGASSSPPPNPTPKRESVDP